MDHSPREYNFLFLVALFLMLVIFIFRFVDRKRKSAGVGMVISGLLLVLEVVLYFFHLQLVPIVKQVCLSLTVFIFLLDVLVFKKTKKRFKAVLSYSVSTVISFCVAIMLFFTFQFPIGTVPAKDGNYLGVYDKILGISETWIDYYEYRSPFFISLKCSYSEYYGMVLGTEKDIFNMSPYDVEYYE